MFDFVPLRHYKVSNFWRITGSFLPLFFRLFTPGKVDTNLQVQFLGTTLRQSCRSAAC